MYQDLARSVGFRYRRRFAQVHDELFNPFKKTVPNKLIIFQFLNDFTGQTCQKGLCNPHYIFPLKCILASEVKFVLKKMLDGTFLKGLN